MPFLSFLRHPRKKKNRRKWLCEWKNEILCFDGFSSLHFRESHTLFCRNTSLAGFVGSSTWRQREARGSHCRLGQVFSPLRAFRLQPWWNASTKRSQQILITTGQSRLQMGGERDLQSKAAVSKRRLLQSASLTDRFGRTA